MPSVLHEALVLLFRNRPSLAPELLRDALGQRLPDYDQVEVQEANLSQITPTAYHADLVVLLRSEAPVFGIVLEVQLGIDADKSYSWPLYAAALRARLRCPTCVLVVAPNESVALWATKPIDVGQPGCPFRPLVLGPTAVPRVTDPAVARRAPELAVLSMQAHGHEPDALELVTAALQAVVDLEHDRGMLYTDLIWLAVNDTMRRQLEGMMQAGYQYQSELAKKYVAEGEAKGRAEGEAKGRAEALLAILAARRIELSVAQQGRIRECSDLAQLDRWIQRAAQAQTQRDVFGSDP